MDYTAQDFTKIGETFDFVLDAVGKTTYFRCRRLLKPKGVFAATDLGPWGQNPLLVISSSITGSHRVIFPLPQSGKAKAFVESLKTRLEAGFATVMVHVRGTGYSEGPRGDTVPAPSRR